MSITVGIGQAQAIDGHEAGLHAVNQALNALSNQAPILGIVIFSYRFDAQQVVSGVASMTGNLPLIGFSTTAAFTGAGLAHHAVVVALLATPDARAEVQWLAGYTQGSREISQQLAAILAHTLRQPALLFADGFNADAEQLCAVMPPGLNLVGALSSGDTQSGNACQIAGGQSGAGGLAVARLEGRITSGVGYGHGWHPVGAVFRITRSRGFWIRTLDGRPASEAYARLFGYPTRDWAFPPLNHLARLYPLGVERPESELLLRSPLRVEADGSFRLNAAVPDGSDAYLLTGSLTACREAARNAVRQAKAALGGAQPSLALVLSDIAWQMLFEAEPGAEIAAVREALGGSVPIIGGYTLGQIVPQPDSRPQYLNQQLVVALFAEPA